MFAMFVALKISPIDPQQGTELSYPDEERRDSEQFFPSNVVSAGHTSPSKDGWPINIFSTKVASAIR